MKAYIVGHDGPEHNLIQSTHRTYERALKALNEQGTELLQEAQSFLERESFHKEMRQKMIRKLSCRDPEKIDNYTHETPYFENITITGHF